MTRYRFVRPDLWRLFWCIVGVAVVFNLLAGTVLYIYEIRMSHDPHPIGEYVNLFFVDITVWGLSLVLTFWQVTVPAVLVLGGLLASLRRRRAA